MKKQITTLLIFILFCPQLFVMRAKGEGLFNDRQKGWNFWNETKTKELPEELPDDDDASSLDQQNKDKLSPWEARNKTLKKKLASAMEKAIDEPSLENVMRAQILQAVVMQKSKEFMDAWSKSALQWGLALNNANNPNPLSQKVQRQQVREQNKIKLSELAKSSFLVLQARKGCGFARAFAPVVAEFAGNYGFELLAATSDGADFENISGVLDGGKLDGLNPKRETPVLYLVLGQTQEVFVISRGIGSIPQMEQNINLMLGVK